MEMWVTSYHEVKLVKTSYKVVNTFFQDFLDKQVTIPNPLVIYNVNPRTLRSRAEDIW